MSTPNPAPEDDKGTPIKANAKTERLIARWKPLHLRLKKIEDELEVVRDAVCAYAVTNGATHIESRLGVLWLRTKSYTDIELVKRQLIDDCGLSAARVEEIWRKAGRQSGPYVEADRKWRAAKKAA